MFGRANLRQELEAVFRAHGVAVQCLRVVLKGLHSPYRQFASQVDEKMQVGHFAVFAHAPNVADQVTSKFDAWEWAKHHARMYVDAPPEATFDRRGVIGGMANAFDRAPIAMGRVKYALHWPLYFRAEFLTLW